MSDLQQIILIGLPGSGKGTQGRLLATRLGLPLVGTGDLLRHEIHEATPVGVQIKPILDAGGMPPTEIVTQIVVSHHQTLQGFVLDGFPRDVPQAQALDAFLVQEQRPSLSSIFYLDVAADILAARLSQRYNCQGCGASYAHGLNETRTTGLCDYCGGDTFIQRSDDQASVVQERLARQSLLQEKLLAYYANKGLLCTINGARGVDDILEDLVRYGQKNRVSP